VDPAFGTGAVKITPAHDFDDYEVARRHDLPMITVLDEDARLNEEAGEFSGLDVREARQAILARLAEMGDLEGEEPHEMVIGRCDRCGTVVEPRLSVQWFIHVKPLAERALASVREGRTRIVPGHFEKVYTHWMENIHDWAVGRQLWWGHRIPAWYCPDGHTTVSDLADGPSACDTCGRAAAELTQETDIFDTWFSSGLWPFSTLGWPDSTPDLARFYPTSVMETAYEILFFWVARMMMLGLFCTDVEPFHTVYLHGIVRDPYGKKMSKTKGNVVDPLEMIEEIGADALRFALVSGNAPGVDQRLTQSKITGGRNFTNKLWNAARFVLTARPEPMAEPEGDPTLPERWIRSRLADATARATRQLDELDLAGYAATVHEVAWSEYCDWFLETAKVELRREDVSPAERARTWRTVAEGLATLLRLLHPILPFVTESIWSSLHDIQPDLAPEPLLVRAAWPSPVARDQDAEQTFAVMAQQIREARNLRTIAGVPAGRRIPLELAAATPEAAAVAAGTATYVESLARVAPYVVHQPGAAVSVPQTAVVIAAGTTWLGGREEGSEAAERRQAQVAHLRDGIARLEALLATPGFVAKAPPPVVEKERARLADLQEQLRQLTG
jgi:valyl-tRNA synthetase